MTISTQKSLDELYAASQDTNWLEWGRLLDDGSTGRLKTLQKACSGDDSDQVKKVSDRLKIDYVAYQKPLNIFLRKFERMSKLLDTVKLREKIKKEGYYLEAYCHEIAVALRSFLYDVDAVTVNVYREESGELTPYGWFGGPSDSFLNQRIKVAQPKEKERDKPLSIAYKLYSRGAKPILITDYKDSEEHGFMQKKEALRAGYESGFFFPLHNYPPDGGKIFIGSIAFHSRKTDIPLFPFYEGVLKAVTFKLAKIIDDKYWSKQLTSRFLKEKIKIWSYLWQRIKEGNTFISKRVWIFLSLIISGLYVFHSYNCSLCAIWWKFIIFGSLSVIILMKFLDDSKDLRERIKKNTYLLCRDKLKEKGPYISKTDFLSAGNEARHCLSRLVLIEIILLAIFAFIVLISFTYVYGDQYWTILQQSKNGEDFNGTIENFWDAIYYSTVTMATTGFDLDPISCTARFVLIGQMFIVQIWILFIISMLITIIVHKSNHWKDLLEGELNQIGRHLEEIKYLNWWWDGKPK